jgi:hypothetical protein
VATSILALGVSGKNGRLQAGGVDPSWSPQLSTQLQPWDPEQRPA